MNKLSSGSYLQQIAIVLITPFSNVLQVVTLRESRAAALKSAEDLKEVNSQLQSNLNLANQRLRVTKQSIQVILPPNRFLASLDRIQEKRSVLVLFQKYQSSDLVMVKAIDLFNIKNLVPVFKSSHFPNHYYKMDSVLYGVMTDINSNFFIHYPCSRPEGIGYRLVYCM